MLALTRALAVCGYLRRANAKGASEERSSDRVRRSIVNWRSTRPFDGSLFLSSGATTNELTVHSFPFGSRSVGFPTLGLEEGRYFRTRDERGVSWSRHASPRPGNVRSTPGDLFDLGRGVQAGPSPEKPLQDPGFPRILPAILFVLIRTLFVHVAGFGAFSSTFPGPVRLRHPPFRRKPGTIGPFFDPKIDTHESRRAGAPASKSNERNTSAQQASFEREKKRGEGPRGSRTAASEGTTRESGRKRNGSAFPKNKRRTRGERGGCWIPRSSHESSSISETERKRKQTGWKTRQDCTIRSKQAWEEWKNRPNHRRRFETKRALLVRKDSAREADLVLVLK